MSFSLPFNLPSFGALLESYRDLRLRRSFGSAARIQFYDTLALLMDNGVQLLNALTEISNVASDDGEKPNAPLAVICNSLIDGVRGGKRLSSLLRRYANYEECSLIASGEKSGDMSEAFERAVKLVQKKAEIAGAVQMATIYPTILGALIVYLLNMVGTLLVPKFAKMTNPETWEGTAWIVYMIGEFVVHYGLLALIAVVVLVAAIMLSMPYLRGTVRIYLDRVFPWSLYRIKHGGPFLLNVAVQTESGVQLRDALESLAKDANPWLRERIEAALYGIGIGANLGVALKNAGYEFPDRLAIRYLVLITNQEGFHGAIIKFSERWMDETVKKAQTIGYVALGVGIIIIGALAMLIMSGVSGMTTSIDAMK